ncbi:MAG: F0F1 ATP synthase subunit B [Rhizobiaceae bacterium]|nr:F0F1 ATP synthase subunit B [Rhizobiaceae bacterium]
MFVAPAFAAEESETNASGTHTETGVAHDAGGGAFPPFDSSTYASQLLWLAITFGLFYLFLKKVVLPRISGILEVRSDRIAQDLDQAARMKEEADAAVAAYEQELADAKSRANTIGQEARDSAKAKADEERRQAEEALGEKLSEAEARIASIKDAAMSDVGKIAEDTASAIVRQLVGSDADKTALTVAVKAARG